MPPQRRRRCAVACNLGTRSRLNLRSKPRAPTLAPRRPQIEAIATASNAEAETTFDCFQSRGYGQRGVDYRGDLAVTSDGDPCQPWGSQAPHAHPFLPENFADKGLKENYCRNPDNDEQPWCYTTNVNRRWQYCDLCAEAPSPPSPPFAPPPPWESAYDWWACVDKGSTGCEYLLMTRHLFGQLQQLQAIIIAIGAIAKTCAGLPGRANGNGETPALSTAGGADALIDAETGAYLRSMQTAATANAGGPTIGSK